MRSRKVWTVLALAAALVFIGGVSAGSGSKANGSGGKAGKRFGKGGKAGRGARANGAVRQDGGRQGGGRGGLNADQIAERLLSFDKNKDGKITKDELPERMQDLVARGDTNKDGSLDKDEIKALSAKLQTEGFGGPGGGARAGRGPGGGGFQGGRGGFGGFGGGLAFLAGQKSVQDELKMSDDQVTKVKEFSEKQRSEGRGAFGGGNFNPEEFQKRMAERAKTEAKAMGDILKPEQLKRLKQISWQREGTRALSNEEVADALKLSTDQKDKIKTIREDSAKEMRAAFTPGGNREEARKKMEDLRKATDDKITALLTADQKTKLKELTGEAFKGEIQRPQFGGFGGGRPRPGTEPRRAPPKPAEPAKTTTTEPKKEEPKATEASKAEQLDKRIDKLIKELEEIRKEIKR